ncbi:MULTISPECIES: LysM peptidoglycan-binding domain-containing protein [Halanaerobium]|uniref:Murein DD-endopeptidase MepM and murein hydrolase activator NlpD, contain LysM domain n=1 Tax=Halanaerobium kushneri TaxID=56779 RepID=A0A1N7BI87_9FIRM|nr:MULTISPECIES: LysM peptidoglycan-binding domain-containing protein [Halanaerobium]RCW61961.1 murein DD-endopeptidase MepM/ murein hydrolase activator NlpD [Halanaerobium sp. ST460_2HS_T2]SIR50966.1 Murein DD-endopeptidase MepM and murein hydrolase activator NlpD, contain LysM domain [Halanaerobium kushneri]
MEKNNYLTTLIILLVFLLSITIAASAFQVRLNDRGRDVIEVQKYLETLGYNVSTDGIFGKTTEDAVKSFQKNNSLKIDGIVGGRTLELLKKMISEKVSYELYVVDNGDTLSGIAGSRDVTVEEIMEFNNMSSSRIKPGQDLKIPRENILTAEAKTQPTNTETKKAQIYYTVRRGDTLSTIAARRNLPVEEIMNANNLNSDFIKIGQELVLPIVDFKASNSSKSETKTKKNNSSSDRIVYKVQRGDALSTIAKMYGTDIDTIRRNNNINGDRIFAGDELVITNYTRGPFKLGRNAFIWPVNGRITSNFGWRTHPIKKTRLFHNGLDIAVPRGTSVRAAASGEVVHSGWMNGFGYTVIIDHGNGVETLYGHNSRVTVARGAMVSKGQQIALSGSSGLSTGPHLHFGVLRNEEPLNPKNYLP